MANIVINDETFPGVASVTLNTDSDTATFLSTDYVLVGTPEVAETAPDMTETDKIYVYVGSETGYTAGNWYYYNGTSWASGGVYGSSGGGISNNARNLLKYILERVAYTETGMQTYVNALYEALKEQGGGGDTPTTYTIINALTNVTNSNEATGIDEGESYSATLTADTDYEIDSVTVTMGGVDVTSTVYSNGVITIASVTGDIVITASARKSALIGYETVGSPTIVNNILTPTVNNFIKTPMAFEPGSSTWTIQSKYRRTANTTEYNDIFGSINASNASAYGLLLEITNKLGGSGSMFVSSNGSSWDVVGSQASQLPSSGWAWVQMQFTGTSYLLKTSSDGETWTTVRTANSTDNIFPGYKIGFGLKRNNVLQGEIDLSECKIWINDQLWWKAV